MNYANSSREKPTHIRPFHVTTCGSLLHPCLCQVSLLRRAAFLPSLLVSPSGGLFGSLGSRLRPDPLSASSEDEVILYKARPWWSEQAALASSYVKRASTQVRLAARLCCGAVCSGSLSLRVCPAWSRSWRSACILHARRSHIYPTGRSFTQFENPCLSLFLPLPMENKNKIRKTKDKRQTVKQPKSELTN